MILFYYTHLYGHSVSPDLKKHGYIHVKPYLLASILKYKYVVTDHCPAGLFPLPDFPPQKVTTCSSLQKHSPKYRVHDLSGRFTPQAADK